MKKLLIIFSILSTIIGLSLLIWFISLYIESSTEVLSATQEEVRKDVGGFINGIVGVFFTITGSFLLFLTLNFQREEFKETQIALANQQFETTFFNMILMLGEIRGAISGSFRPNADNYYIGQVFLHEYLSYLKNHYKYYIKENQQGKILNGYLKKSEENKLYDKMELDNIEVEMNSFYMKLYKRYQSQLGHYFRYIYNIIKYTIDNRSKFEDEKKYIDLLQAQLSNDELALIFYNATSSNGLNTAKKPQFKDWLEKYQFLENLDSDSLLDRRHHILYSKTKFKFLNRDELANKIQ